MSASVTGPKGLNVLVVIGHALEYDVPSPLNTYSLSYAATTICSLPFCARSPAARYTVPDPRLTGQPRRSVPSGSSTCNVYCPEFVCHATTIVSSFPL